MSFSTRTPQPSVYTKKQINELLSTFSGGEMQTISQIQGDITTITTNLTNNYFNKSVINDTLSNIYTKPQTNSLLLNFYTKSEIDVLLDAQNNFSSILVNYYTTAETDSILSFYYNKSSIDGMLAQYYKSSDVTSLLTQYYLKSQVYSKAEVFNKGEIQSNYYNIFTIEDILATLYTKSETDALFIDFYDKSNIDTRFLLYYTKLEINNFFSSYITSAQIATSYYNKTSIDNTFTLYFTQTQINAMLNDYYTKVQTDGLFANYYNKTNIDTTLLSYYNKTDVDGILTTNYYTKSNVNTLLLDYAKPNDISVALLNYYNKTYVDANFYVKTAIDTKFLLYYAKSEIDTKFLSYSTNTEIIAILNDFATLTDVQNSLVNYVLTTTLNNYYTTSQTDTLLLGKINTSKIDTPYGIPSLDGSGKVKISQLPYGDLLVYKGLWNGTTPILTDGFGSVKGDVWIAGFTGTYNFGSGSVQIYINDWIVYNGTNHQVNRGNDNVSSFNTRTGAIVPVQTDYDTFFYTKAISDGKYALMTGLNNYVLSTTLNSYSTTVGTNTLISNAITANNTNYYDKTASDARFLQIANFNTTISGYQTVANMTDYVLSSSLTTTLGSYVLSSALTTTLNSYSTTSAIALNYYDKTTSDGKYALITSLNNYVLSTTLNSYSTTSAIALSYYDKITSDNKYATILLLNSYSDTLAMNSAISGAISTNNTNYSTTSATNTLISNAISSNNNSYYTKIASDTKFALLSGCVLTGVLQYSPTVSLKTGNQYNLIDVGTCQGMIDDALLDFIPMSVVSYSGVSNAQIALSNDNLITVGYANTYYSPVGNYASIVGNNAFTGTNTITNNAQRPLLIQQATGTGNAITEIGILNNRLALGTNYKSRLALYNNNETINGGFVEFQNVSATQKRLTFVISNLNNANADFETMWFASDATAGVSTNIFSNIVNINSSVAGGFTYLNLRNQGTGNGTDMRISMQAGLSKTYLDCQQVSATQTKYATYLLDGAGLNGLTFQDMINDAGTKSINYYVPIVSNSAITSVGLTTTDGLTASGGVVSLTTTGGIMLHSGNLNGSLDFHFNNANGTANSGSRLTLTSTASTSNYRISMINTYVSPTQIRCSWWSVTTGTAVEAWGFTNISNVFAFFQNGNTVINGTLSSYGFSATTGTFTGLISGSNGLTISVGTSSLKAITGTSLTVSGNTSLLTGTITTAPANDTNIANKLYVDNLIKILTPKLNCISYDCGNPSLAISTFTNNYYEYNVSYGSGTYKTTNIIYPNVYSIKQRMILTSASHYVMPYYAFSVLNTSVASVLQSCFFGFMGDLGVISGFTTNWTANPNYYLYGINQNTNQFLFQATWNNLTNFIQMQNITNFINSNSFVQPTAELIVVLSIGGTASVGFHLNIINAGTNAVIYNGWLNFTGANFTALPNASNIIPAITIDTTANINKLRIYHTLNDTMITNLNTANTGVNFTNSINLFKN